MDAMILSAKTVNNLVAKIAGDYPQFKFKTGRQEHWSPKTNTITYDPDDLSVNSSYGLLHELAHALLEHNSYKTDFELLKLESLAWQKAAQIGSHYGVEIDDDHIQNCLDTYRDWLHRRSKCPTCGVHVMQADLGAYKCFNCQTSWQVSSGRFARSYRRKN